MRLSLGAAAAAALVALLVAPAPSSGQSLADLAKKEKERRKATQGSGKTYTEDDLGKRGGRPNIGVAEGSSSEAGATSGATATTAATGSGSEGGGEAAAGETDDRDARLTQWRQEVQKADDELARATSELERLQAAAGQDLYNATLEVREQRRLAVEEAEGKLAAARQKVDQLEAEGRRNAFRR